MKRRLYSFSRYFGFIVFFFLVMINQSYTQATSYRIEDPDKKIKAYGDTIWYEDFDSSRWSQYSPGQLPDGWSMGDSANLGFYWNWSINGPRGRFTSPNAGAIKEELLPAQWIVDQLNEDGASCSNGFLLHEIDFYNTMADGDYYGHYNQALNMNSWFKLPPIESRHTGKLHISFRQSFRSHAVVDNDYYLNIFPEYNDYSHGLSYECIYYITDNNALEIDRFKVFDISGYSGMDSIANIFTCDEAYIGYWLIDDILFYEPYDYNIVIEKATLAINGFNFFFHGVDRFNRFANTNIPLNQFDQVGNVVIFARNYGANDINNFSLQTKINNQDGEVLLFLDTVYTDLLETERKEFEVGVNLNISKIGNYNCVSEFLNSDEVTPEDNLYELKFNITNNFYSHTNGLTPDRIVSTEILYEPSNDGDAMLSGFTFIDSTKVDSIGVFIWNNKNYIENIENGEFKIMAVCYKSETEYSGLADAPLMESDEYILTLNDTMKYVYLSFNTDQIIEPGTYYFGVECYTGSDDYSIEIPLMNNQNWMGIYFTDKTNSSIWKRFSDAPFIDVYLELEHTNLDISVDLSSLSDLSQLEDSAVTIFISNDNHNFSEIDLVKNDSNIYQFISNDYLLGDSIYFNFSVNDQFEENELRSAWLDEINKTIFINDILILSAKEIINYSYYNIFPNPVSKILTIKNCKEIENNIGFFNIKGEKVLVSPSIYGKEIKIDVSHLHSGIYFIKINKETYRIIINH